MPKATRCAPQCYCHMNPLTVKVHPIHRMYGRILVCRWYVNSFKVLFVHLVPEAQKDVFPKLSRFCFVES